MSKAWLIRIDGIVGITLAVVVYIYSFDIGSYAMRLGAGAAFGWLVRQIFQKGERT